MEVKDIMLNEIIQIIKKVLYDALWKLKKKA